MSLLVTDREIDGGGYNRVLGPDFQWRPTRRDTITGQLLFSRTRTPNRPELAEEWTGQSLAGHGLDLWYSHQTSKLDWFGEGKDFSDEFRAYNGFVPQVGYRSGYAEAGRTFRPQGFLRRVRTFAIAEGQEDRQGALINREYSFGAGMDGRFNSFMRFRYGFSRVRAGEVIVPRQRLYYNLNASPTRWLNDVALEGFVGQDADFDNARPGTGADVRLSGTLRPTNHIELRLNTSRRWLDVDPPDQRGRAAVHRPGRARARDLHVHVSRFPAPHRPIRGHAARPVAVHRRDHRPRRLLQRLRPLRLQAQLADGAVRGVRRQPGPLRRTRRSSGRTASSS